MKTDKELKKDVEAELEAPAADLFQLVGGGL